MLVPGNTRLAVSKYILLFMLLNTIFLQSQSAMKVSGITEFESSNLPIIFIDTHDQLIQDEQRIIAHMGIIFNGADMRNYITDDFNNYNGRISIELRGSSSSAYPKPQFSLETQDSLGENLNVSLCGLPNENDWILNGPYADKSLIRNVLSYKLSNEMGRYASRTVYCELILNGEYLGLYILMEKLKRDNDRINISTLTQLDNSGDELTGGYIVKIDKLDGENVDYWFSNLGTLFQYHYPKADEITIPQKDYIVNFLDEFEYLMNSSIYNDPLTGYHRYIEVDSFIDHFILNEFAKNVDAYRLSSFYYKDKDSVDPKLIAGPIWDFNLTYGDAWIPEEAGLSDGWQTDYSKLHPDDPFKVPFWWNKLLQDNLFTDKLNQRWNYLRENILSYDSLFAQIDNTVTHIKESRIRNFERWPEILSGSYNDEILRLKGWIIRRLTWIDNNVGLLTFADDHSINEKKQGFELHQNYPNPFNPSTTITYTIPQGVTLNNNSVHIKLNIMNVLGENVATLINEMQNPGIYTAEWNAMNMPSGLYIYRLRIEPANNSEYLIQTKKMILLK